MKNKLLKILKNWFIALIFLFFTPQILVYSQTFITGKVLDSATQKPIAFAHIYVDKQENEVILSDIDGNFKIQFRFENKTISCSYLGYKTIHREISKINTNHLILYLQETTNQLEEVIILQSENPAFAIMKKTHNYREQNNPYAYSGFSYQCYNKYVIDANNLTTSDSLKLDKGLNGGHLLLSESISKRTFIPPNNQTEVVLASRLSGLKEYDFAMTTEDIQPISFYENPIKLLENDYQNPLFDTHFTLYKYRLRNTLIREKDTLYIISFSPKNTSKPDLLKGDLYISSYKMGIEKVSASPQIANLYNVSIKQEYTQIGTHWFPKTLHYQIDFKNKKVSKFQFNMSGKSYFTDIQINQPQTIPLKVKESIIIDPLVNTRDSIFWSQHRAYPLNYKERITYQTIDSIGKVTKLDKIYSLSKDLIFNKLTWGKFNIDLLSLYRYNAFENSRFGIGLESNQIAIKHFTLGTYMGYGIQDKEWKWGSILKYTSPDFNHNLSISYQKDLLEWGKSSLEYYPNFSNRSFIGYQFDPVENITISYSPVLLKHFDFNISTTYQNTFLQSIENQSIDYKNVFATLNIKYTPNDKKTRTSFGIFKQKKNYPYYSVSLQKGFSGIFNSELNYFKATVQTDFLIQKRSLGKNIISLHGGYIDRVLPHGMMFTGQGNKQKPIVGLYENFFFQTMYPYEFTSNLYGFLFYSHSFRPFSLFDNRINPVISIHQNVGYAKLVVSKDTTFSVFNLQSMPKGYVESGVSIDPVFAVNVKNIVKIGVGLNGFYRYGYYRKDTFKDNLNILLNFSFITR